MKKSNVITRESIVKTHKIFTWKPIVKTQKVRCPHCKKIVPEMGYVKITWEEKK